MVLVSIFVGTIFGVFCSSCALMMGSSILQTLLVHSLGGTTAIIALSLVIFLRQAQKGETSAHPSSCSVRDQSASIS